MEERLPVLAEGHLPEPKEERPPAPAGERRPPPSRVAGPAWHPLPMGVLRADACLNLTFWNPTSGGRTES